MKRKPWFPFYPADWLIDSNVSAMTLEQKGAYIDLLCRCWLEGSISNNPLVLSRVLGTNYLKFSKTIWPAVHSRFIPSSFEGHLTSARMEAVRQEQEERRAKNSKAAKERWDKDANALQEQCETDASRAEQNRAKERKTREQPSAARIEFDFDAVYDRFPSKKGKAKGLEKLKALVKTQAEYEAVLRGAAKYADEVRINRTEKKYILNFSTWANGKRWEDYPAPASATEANGTVDAPMTALERIKAREAAERAGAP